MPKISVIVPVYKVEPYLRRCVDSILAQTFTDFELILVDDGSPDGCPAICDEYAEKDSRVHVIHQQNGGVSSARNAGLDAACGNYIAFCDGDDYMNGDWLRTLYFSALKEEADMVMGNYIDVDSNGVELSRSNAKRERWIIKTVSDRNDYLINHLLTGGHGWAVWSALFSAKIIEENKIRFCETCGNYAEDLSFVLAFSLYMSCECCIEFSGYYYVRHEGSLMSDSKSKIRLNELNQVSCYFGEHWMKVYGESDNEKLYPVIHTLIMYTEYRRIVWGTNGVNYSDLPTEIQKINDKKWFYRFTRNPISLTHKIKKVVNKAEAQYISIVARYSCIQNPFIFRLESAVYFRVRKYVNR